MAQSHLVPMRSTIDPSRARSTQWCATRGHDLGPVDLAAQRQSSCFFTWEQADSGTTRRRHVPDSRVPFLYILRLFMGASAHRGRTSHHVQWEYKLGYSGIWGPYVARCYCGALQDRPAGMSGDCVLCLMLPEIRDQLVDDTPLENDSAIWSYNFFPHSLFILAGEDFPQTPRAGGLTDQRQADPLAAVVLEGEL